MDISIIVPLYNEAESLPHLYEWIARVMKENKFSYEVIFVNDGSIDNSWEVINQLKVESLKLKEGAVRAICFRRNYGKSAALLPNPASNPTPVSINIPTSPSTASSKPPATKPSIPILMSLLIL